MRWEEFEEREKFVEWEELEVGEDVAFKCTMGCQWSNLHSTNV